MLPLLMTLLTSSADAGFGDSSASATFTGLNPMQYVVLLDGQPLPYIPQLSGFVGVGLAGGEHVFQMMTVTGQVVLQTGYGVTAGVHEDCAMTQQGASFVPSCSRAAHPPYTVASLAQLGAAAPGSNINISTAGVGAPPPAAPPAPPPPPAAPAPIGESQLQQLIKAVKDASFSDDQVSVLKTAAARNHFTCAQVVRLLEPISFSDAKLQSIAALKSAIVDPENAFQLEAAMTFSGDKEKVRALFR